VAHHMAVSIASAHISWI